MIKTLRLVCHMVEFFESLVGLLRISNKQDNDEWRIARSITAGVACLAIEDPKRLNFAAMRAKGGNRKKGMNRTMSYSRPGALGAKTIQKIEERGGTIPPVDPRNTSLRCPRCYFACKESRDCEDYDCIMCGWYHMPTRTAHPT